MKIIKRIEKASERWNNGIVVFTSTFLMGIMMLVVADSFGRYVFLKPIKGAVEVEQIMMAYAGFMAFAYGLIKRTHVRMTLVVSRLPQRLQVQAEIFAGIIGIFVFILLTWGGIQLFQESWLAQEIMPAAVKIPYWLAKLAVPMGALLMTIQLMIYIMHHLGILLARESKG